MAQPISQYLLQASYSLPYTLKTCYQWDSLSPRSKQSKRPQELDSIRAILENATTIQEYPFVETHPNEHVSTEQNLRDFGICDEVYFYSVSSCLFIFVSVTIDLKFHNQIYSAPEKQWYARMIGSLIYAMLGTRVNIVFSVSILSQWLANQKPGLPTINRTKVS